jgi:hypothetical protein
MILAAVLSAWLQYAADGQPHARALVTNSCPVVTLGSGTIPMHQRAPLDMTHDFDEAVCEATLPANATNVRIAGRKLPSPPKTVNTVIVFGDTGCRMKGGEQQNCGDIASWPFPRIARTMARVHADLAISVGDYYYRENNCAPEIKGCINYWGDTSMSWMADWFEPGAPLFESVPLVLTRGNHEDCHRGGAGWFRYLEPSGRLACPNPITAADGTPPYAVALDRLRLVMIDSAGDASDSTADPARVAYYQAAFDAAPGLGGSGGGTSWIVTHRPPFANANMTAVIQPKPADVTSFDAVLAGHVHDFVAMNVGGYPPLVVNGESGDELDEANATQEFVTANKYTLAKPDPFASKQFGFAVYTRTFAGWSISLRDQNGVERRRCTLSHRQVSC